MRVRSIIYGLTLCLAAAFAGPLAAQNPARPVLVVQSYHAAYNCDDQYIRGLREVLADRVLLEFFELDTKRRPKAEFADRTRAALAVVNDLKPDLVILSDDNALDFLGEELGRRAIPMVFLGVSENPRYYFADRRLVGVTGILERPLLKRYLELAQALNPGLRDVLVVFDTSRTSAIFLSDSHFFAGVERQRILRMNLEKFATDSLDVLKTRIATAHEAYGAIFVVGVYTVSDAAGVYVPGPTILNWMQENARIPVYGFWRPTVGKNRAVAGYVIDGYATGKQAGAMAMKILSGTPIGKIPVERQNEAVLVVSRAGLTR